MIVLYIKLFCLEEEDVDEDISEDIFESPPEKKVVYIFKSSVSGSEEGETK